MILEPFAFWLSVLLVLDLLLTSLSSGSFFWMTDVNPPDATSERRKCARFLRDGLQIMAGFESTSMLTLV